LRPVRWRPLRAAPLLPCLVALACGPEPLPAPPAPEVTVAKPIRRPVQEYEEFTGVTRATEFAEIRARVPGTLDAILFEPTTLVEKGEVLFEIERAPYAAELEAAEASLLSAQAELRRAAAELERVEIAAKSRAVSEQSLDSARANRDQARAAVLGAKAHRDQAEIDLGYTRPASPVDGLVGRNYVDVGNLVGQGEPTLLATVNRIAPLYVYFNAEERVVLELLEERRKRPPDQKAEKGRVTVASSADEGFPHEGVVDFVDNTVDPRTGTIEVRAVLSNDDLVLFPGLFVRVRVLAQLRESLLVQERAVGSDIGGKYVLTVGEGNVVDQRYVTLGPVQDDGTVLVREGLEGGETYIVNGMLRARPGFPVTPQTEADVAAEGTDQSAPAGEGPGAG
jgi:RND family efflux transporter MFP subunit